MNLFCPLLDKSDLHHSSKVVSSSNIQIFQPVCFQLSAMLSNCNDLVLAKSSYYPLRCIASYFLDQIRSAVLELKKKTISLQVHITQEGNININCRVLIIKLLSKSKQGDSCNLAHDSLCTHILTLSALHELFSKFSQV